ncbi:AAA family ATPase [Micromonospora sp. IBHARD004]|uniref:AAA family ATPase n=1 Tax=Micromonospora sp. IBHARD004 TaxID=3457764 RepID=UPI004059703F
MASALDDRHHDGVPILFLIVGLPGAGKTRLAHQLAAEYRALRLTPDEWMIPLFGEPEGDGRRDVLEGRLLWLALEAATLGTSVVLDFGFWSRDERTAVRAIASEHGVAARVNYLPIDRETQIARIAERLNRAPETTFPMTAADLEAFASTFEVPTLDELNDGPLDGPPIGGSWRAWAAVRWPSFRAS